MSLVYEDGEVFGGDLLDLAVVAGAMFMVVALLWAPMASWNASPQGQPIEQVTVVAHASPAGHAARPI